MASLERELRTRGHDVVAVDLPCEDDSAGCPSTPTRWSMPRRAQQFVL